MPRRLRSRPRQRPRHSAVAKPDRLRDKSPPSRHLAAHQHRKDCHDCPDRRPSRAIAPALAALGARASLIAARRCSAGAAGSAQRGRRADPVVAKVNGVEIRAERPRAGRGGHRPERCQQLDRRRQARLSDRLSRRRDPGGQGRRGQEGRRPEGLQEPPRLHPQQAADGDAARRRKARPRSPTRR